ncbi:MAG TPA: PIN domain-containing protein [Bryobacteraceae bacterium]|nr:PIN domain-containing protein [Bryobacteraceae bacterium]
MIVLGEYRFGIFQSQHRGEYKRWLANAISVTRLFEIAEATTHHYASIRMELKRAGKPMPSNDLWIAALCREHRHHLLSRDLHFDWVEGLRRLGW